MAVRSRIALEAFFDRPSIGIVGVRGRLRCCRPCQAAAVGYTGFRLLLRSLDCSRSAAALSGQLNLCILLTKNHSTDHGLHAGHGMALLIISKTSMQNDRAQYLCRGSYP
jgi:hypothetical protein